MFYKEPKYFFTKTLEPNEDHYHQRIQKKKKGVAVAAEATKREKGLPKFQLLIFVNGRAIYGFTFILNMAENLSPEEDLESLRVQ